MGLITQRCRIAMDPIYLSVEQVLELHEEAIDSFGGMDGLTDPEVEALKASSALLPGSEPEVRRGYTDWSDSATLICL
jgi:hypothetical protein